MKSSEKRPPLAWHEYPHIVFDVEGTLLDSNVAQVWSWQDAIEEENLFFPHYTLFSQLGLSGPQISEKYEFALRDRKTAQQVAVRAHRLFFERYAQWVKPFDGAIQLLKRLKARSQSRLYALSAASELEARAILKRLGLDRYFELTLTADSGGGGKSPAAPFTRLKEIIGPKSLLIAVGDSPFDFRSASVAGVPFVFIGQGGFPREWFERVHTRFFNIRQMLDSLGGKIKKAA